MLVEFTVANYRSFLDSATLSLEGAPIRERNDAVNEANLALNGLLRVAGIYGANASGKSNLLRAARVMRQFVLDSAREGQVGDQLPHDPFRLDADSENAPSEFEVVFVLGDRQYRYGFAMTESHVEREWLHVRRGDDEERLGFGREGQKYQHASAWKRDASLERKTRDAALHLSVAAAWDHPLATELVGWFRALDILDGSSLAAVQDRTRDQLSEANGLAIQELIRRLDVGIERVGPRLTGSDIVRAARNARADNRSFKVHLRPSGVRTRHRRTDNTKVEFDLADESAGTIKLFRLAGPIVHALATGGVLFIDEFEAQLHTLLAQQLVQLFQDPTTNLHDAQLIFATHDTNLLTRSLLRRDQLWFVEKSRKTGASDLYSLAEIKLDGKKVRNDARYEVEYLEGRYGAIPFFGNLRPLLGAALPKVKASR